MLELCFFEHFDEDDEGDVAGDSGDGGGCCVHDEGVGAVGAGEEFHVEFEDEGAEDCGDGEEKGEACGFDAVDAEEDCGGDGEAGA